ncbi:MAG: hypothetical protein PF569_06460 [Candidatus Woesearchaeota archaeon]|jgi:hypothetical protein|nr:hypothetical protein [Candidatus Woesearchaeota archaeon]
MPSLISLEEFTEKYESTGYLPSPSRYTGKSKLNDKQLATKYKEHVRKVEALNNKESGLSYQAEWEECREAVYKRDGEECQLWKVLTDREKDIAIQSGYSLYGYTGRLTPAHFIPRSKSTKLRCEVDNVYTICIMFHSRLDLGEHPLTGEYIKSDRVLNDWWSRILNKEVFEKYKGLY